MRSPVPALLILVTGISLASLISERHSLPEDTRPKPAPNSDAVYRPDGPPLRVYGYFLGERFTPELRKGIVPGDCRNEWIQHSDSGFDVEVLIDDHGFVSQVTGFTLTQGGRPLMKRGDSLDQGRRTFPGILQEGCSLVAQLPDCQVLLCGNSLYTIDACILSRPQRRPP